MFECMYLAFPDDEPMQTEADSLIVFWRGENNEADITLQLFFQARLEGLHGEVTIQRGFA